MPHRIPHPFRALALMGWFALAALWKAITVRHAAQRVARPPLGRRAVGAGAVDTPLLQVLIDVANRKRVDEVAHARQRLVGRMEIRARKAEERAVVERHHDRAVGLNGSR